MTISQAKRQSVRQRANECCEYCRLPSASVTVPFQIDHIIPIKHDGSDELDNLCLSCYPCNAHKSHDLTGFDPLTGKITVLFHPRQHIWSEHFELTDEMHIQGRTPQGRTTVNVLQMNTDERVESRQVLAEISKYPCKQPESEVK